MGGGRITAQDFYDYNKCPHRVYLNGHGNASEKLPLADFLNLLFERALLHERDVIKELPHEMPAGEKLQERAQSTLAMMKVGVDRIYQGVLLLADDSGIPDLLEKMPGRSAFGPYYYKPVDIKIGSGYENEKAGELRHDYALQLFHYGTLLESVQGFFPPIAEILNRHAQRVAYQLADFVHDYQCAYPLVRELVSGNKTNEPARCSDCHFCQWWGHCETILVKAQDVSLLPGVGRSLKESMNSAGIDAIRDIPPFDFEAVKVKGVGAKRCHTLKQLATVAITGKLEVIAQPALPNPPLKIYFDFEDDPTQQLIYLCGLLLDPPFDGEQDYYGFTCVDDIGELTLWRRFEQFCVRLAPLDFCVFHYSPYERTKLAYLERKYGASQPQALDLFRGRMVDLIQSVKASVVPPTRGYGLKEIAPLAGHEYSMEDPGGAEAIVWFQEYQKNQARTELLHRILTYNREDCTAVKAVYEWLGSIVVAQSAIA